MEKENVKKFDVYAVPCDKPFIVEVENIEAFKKQCEKSREKNRKMIENWNINNVHFVEEEPLSTEKVLKLKK